MDVEVVDFIEVFVFVKPGTMGVGAECVWEGDEILKRKQSAQVLTIGPLIKPKWLTKTSGLTGQKKALNVETYLVVITEKRFP